MRSDTAVLNVPGASRFATSLCLTVTQLQSDDDWKAAASVDVLFTVRCTAGLPWCVQTHHLPCMTVRKQGQAAT